MTENVTLNNGTSMPLFGLGVFQITDAHDCERTVADALALGYRMIDTAACYGNEKAVGAAIQKSGVPREVVYLSSCQQRRWHSLKQPPQKQRLTHEALGSSPWPDTLKGR